MNNRTRPLSFLIIAWGIVLIFCGAGCTPNHVSGSIITPLMPNSMVIYSSMTRNFFGTHGVLNIYAHVPTPASGKDEEDLTATLWLVIVDRPQTYTSFEVRYGQTISFEGYDIHILRIAKYDKYNYFVEVEVNEAE